MPIEWAMMDELLVSEDNIVAALQNNWEPFAVADGKIYFKQQVFNEDREPRSSTRNRLSDEW